MTDRKLWRKRGLALLLSLTLLLAACGSDTSAATMRLMRTEGRVHVSDDDGSEVTVRENLGLYSGYSVETRLESFAWINLDDVKLTKMDESSEIEITKDGRDLDIRLRSGSLFFNVTEPLEDDESMRIRTSTMAVGIRGTCGWVTEDAAYLLEGSVSVKADDQRVTVSAGEMVMLMEDGTLEVRQFSDEDIPSFVLEEVEDDEELMSAVSGGGTPDGPDGGAWPTVPGWGPQTGGAAEPGASPSPSDGPAPAAPVGYTDSGSCGEDAWWGYDEETKTLTIGGSGKMEDASSSTAARPWSDYIESIETITIENGITRLGSYAFIRCTNLTSVTIPDSVTGIGYGAFNGCARLESVEIPNGVTHILDGSFTDCSSLTEITIPDGVTSIRNYAFLNCTGLTSVTIPSSVTSIDNSAFLGCTGLAHVYYTGTEEQWVSILFSLGMPAALQSAAIHYNFAG